MLINSLLPYPNSSLKDFLLKINNGFQLDQIQKNSEFRKKRLSVNATRLQTPNPVYAKDKAIIPDPNDVIKDILVCFLKSIFLVSIVLCMILKALNMSPSERTCTSDFN